MKKPRIIFMGTPDFAVPSLQILLENGYEIIAVITAVDKPAGRGMKLSESAIKIFALSQNLKIFQPEKLKDPGFINELSSLNADLQIVVAFRMLPEVVWNMPPMGTINLHGSLLPQYRGAAPVNWAVINGETETGVTTFKLKHEIDTGNILLQRKIEIGEVETAGELYNRMKEIGAELLLQTIANLEKDTALEVPQDTMYNSTDGKGIIHLAPKITSDICKIKWEKSVEEIYNLVRGLSPYPAAFTLLRGKILKIFKAEKEKEKVAITPGEIISDNKTFLKFACSDGYISLKELQLEGKKRMSVEDFLKGWRS
ncbi:MAG: methionyl-tRNA formyltransferase [Ginsengibacter sp.]